MSIFSTNFIKKRHFVKADEKKIPQKNGSKTKAERMKNMKIYDYHGKKNICGEAIRIQRCKKRMSQTELAAKMQLNDIFLERDSISRIEIGTRFVSDYELKVFAKVLGVSVDKLLEEEDE